MCMKLILNGDPRWTDRHLEFIKRYIRSYGGSIDESWYDSESHKILNGNPSSRCESNQLCYGIYDEDDYLGDLIIDDENEIDITIFDEFSGKNYAYKAIDIFIKEIYKELEDLEAVIRKENPYKCKIQKILKNVGFELKETSIEGNEIWVYTKL